MATSLLMVLFKRLAYTEAQTKPFIIAKWHESVLNGRTFLCLKKNSKWSVTRYQNSSWQGKSKLSSVSFQTDLLNDYEIAPNPEQLKWRCNLVPEWRVDLVFSGLNQLLGFIGDELCIVFQTGWKSSRSRRHWTLLCKLCFLTKQHLRSQIYQIIQRNEGYPQSWVILGYN